MIRPGLRGLCLCLVCVILPSMMTACFPTANSTQNIEEILYYQQIPGVTQDEIDAIEALKKEYGSFSYAHTLETESYLLPDGSFTGFHYSVCQLLTRLFGIEFTGAYYEEWDELLDSFECGESDFTGVLTASAERMEKYHMSHPIADRTLGVYTYGDSKKLQTETDIQGLTVGFIRNTITSSLIQNAYDVSFTIVLVDESADAVTMLKNGDIDAFITASAVDPNFLDYDNIQSKIMFPLAYTSASLSTANPELAHFITVMDKYLAAGGIDVLVDMYQECNFQYMKYKLGRSLTEEERAYIDDMTGQQKQVQAALEYDNYPISFYNSTEGQFQGIAIDILRDITKLTGIEFASATERETTWGEVLQRLYTGEISLVTQMFYSDSRVGDYIWSEVPFDYTRYALLSKTEHPHYTFVQVSRLKVGAMGSSLYATMYQRWFPNLDNLTTYKTLDDGFAALENDEIDLLMTAENMLLTLTNYREKSGYKVNMSFNSPIESRLGLNKDETILCSIIDKAQAYVNVTAISDNWTRRFFDYERKVADERANYMMIFASFLSVMLLTVVLLLINNAKKNKQRMVAEERALQASRSKSVFLANMSHEIRTPLSAIIGMSEIAKRSIAEPDKALASINQVLLSSHHLLGVLNDVLDMSKIESGKLELTSEPFGLIDAYSEVANIFRQSCSENNIHFITNNDDLRDITLIGDKMRINQVLINLLGNAVKFTGQGGEIKFLLEVLFEDERSIRLGFLVSDNGVGMSEEQMEKLFAPFEQGSNSIASKYGGTGLGLSISQNLVNRMGGHITVKSRLHEGTDFYFELTFEKGDEGVSVSAEELPMPDLRGKRILLVEDIDINRVIAGELLSPSGAAIDEAVDGEQAVEIFENAPVGWYDLIFMDIQMPKMDGYASTGAIRALPREDARSIPIIAMTANSYKEDVEQCLAAGMNGHIGKPIDPGHLADALNRWVADG